MKSTRTLLALVAVTAAALGVMAAGASATHTVTIPSKVSIKSESLEFSGHITAGKYEPCVQQRKVLLYKVISGGPDQVVGRDTSSNKGAWDIEPQGSAGISLARFYAKVTKLSQGAAGTIYVCQAGRSKTIKVSN